jgi:hypothetical protein
VRPSPLTSLLIAALLVVPAGCGDSGDESDGTYRPTRVETPHVLPDLPAGWREYENPAGGFALGLAPGWTAREDGTRSLIRSLDRLVAVTISADRTDEALALAPEASAIRTLEALEGFQGVVRPGNPRPFRHRYDAVEVEASGTAVGIRQRLRLVFLRRDDLAVITALVAENAEQHAGAQAATALEMLRTLRTQPVG